MTFLIKLKATTRLKSSLTLAVKHDLAKEKKKTRFVSSMYKHDDQKFLCSGYCFKHHYFITTGILEIRTVSEGGILAIKGVKSQYYICMSKAGQLQGKVIFLLLSVGCCQ